MTDPRCSDRFREVVSAVERIGSVVAPVEEPDEWTTPRLIIDGPRRWVYAFFDLDELCYTDSNTPDPLPVPSGTATDIALFLIGHRTESRA